MSTLLIKNGVIVTMDKKNQIFQGDILIENDRIKTIASSISAQADKVIDASHCIVSPGFIQTHVHLTQALFRGQADDLELLDWLKKKIWPLEASHTPESNYYSAKLGLAELIRCGTTAIVDMETVHHTHESFTAIYESGIRAVSGKCMMDYNKDVPQGLMESAESSIRESVKLLKEWHMKDNGRIRYAFNPRFVVSCSEDLLVQVRDLSQEYNVMIHTHASENRGEIEFVEKDRGYRNIVYLHKLGLTGPNLILAHCIWLDDQEISILRDTGTKVSHCPNSNLKLASGIAKVPELLEAGIDVSLGADGAPCNNNMDIFHEMRTAALIQKVRLLSPIAMPAQKVMEMATINGAKALGLEHEIGSLEEGKKADLIIVDTQNIHMSPSINVNPISLLVYSATANDVLTTIVDGKILMENKKLLTLHQQDIIQNCNRLIQKFVI